MRKVKYVLVAELRSCNLVVDKWKNENGNGKYIYIF